MFSLVYGVLSYRIPAVRTPRSSRVQVSTAARRRMTLAMFLALAEAARRTR